VRIAITISLLLISAAGFAQSGEVDQTFGNAGEQIYDIDDLDKLHGLIKDDGGNIYFYGGVSDNQGGIYPFDFFVGKMFPNGQLDLSFGSNGYLRGDFPNHEICFFQNAALADDGIIFMGNGRNFGQTDTNNFYLTKVDWTGQVDVSFANGGFFTDSLLGIYNTPGSVIVDSESKVVFCGSSTDFQSTYVEYPFVGRLNPDGSRDSTFGQTGILLYDYYGNTIIDGMHVPDYPDRHGDGAYLDELIEINDNYFLIGKLTTTSYNQLHMMSFNKSGDFNADFVAQGLYPLQIDPGSNHQITDIQKKDSMVYMALHTSGNLYANQQIILPVTEKGLVQDVIAFEHESQDERSNFFLFHNEQLVVGGYSEEKDNTIPGHFSDEMVAYVLNSDGNFQNDFGLDGRFSYQSSNTDFEQGVDDAVISNGSLVLGGYANRIDGDNVTDFLFVSTVLEEDLQITEEPEDSRLYPNPSKGFFFVPENATALNCYSLDGKQIFYERQGRQVLLSNNFQGVLLVTFELNTKVFSKKIVITEQ